MQILKLPLFWRIAPLLALTAGTAIALQTLWAGPWFRDVLGLAPPEVARSLFWMAAAFMVGIFLVGVVADRLQRRGIGPMTVLLGFVIANLVAQAAIVMQVKVLAFPAWLRSVCRRPVGHSAYPWFAARGRGLAGRSNATINFAMFLVAFVAQAFVGVVIGWFPQSAAGYDPLLLYLGLWPAFGFGVFGIVLVSLRPHRQFERRDPVTNPIIAEVTRGGIVESRHTGAFAVVDGAGKLIKSAGDFAAPIFPRSAIKAFQCVPVIESGAADRFGFTEEEIALACSSHNGEPDHVRVARSMLQKAGENEAHYECGAHWPMNLEAQHDVVRHGSGPLQVHNNCSGKHAGMLALSRQLGADPKDYVKIEHPVQQAVAKAIARIL